MKRVTLQLLLAFSALGGVSRDAASSVALIVNMANPVDEISAREVRDVLTGEMRDWPSHRRITIVQREPENPVTNVALKRFLNMSPEEYNRLLLHEQFRGEQPPPIKVLHSDSSACNFVFNAPGAIGFVSAEAVEKDPCRSHVRVLRVSGKR